MLRKETHRLSAVLLAAALLAVPAFAGETGSRAMSGWFNVTTPDGWVGKRYMDGNEIFAEEFDSNSDARIDVWRFYRRGILSSEERDLNADGKINYQSRWEPRGRRLVSVLRDTRWRGVNDLEIEATGSRTWEIREDRNLDGVTDRILFVNGPSDLFERLGMDLAVQTDIIDSIPVEYWSELWSDDTFTGSITDYRRYSKGRLTHYGAWDGRKVAWKRTPPDFEPPPPPEPEFVAPAGPVEHGPNCPIPNCPEAICRVEPSDAPITDVREDPQYGGMVGEVYTDPQAGPYDPTYGQTYQDPYPVQQPYLEPPGTLGTPPPLRDRTRYEGLPPGESAARSLPARMRPPGVGR